jgi:hypothetical protein
MDIDKGGAIKLARYIALHARVLEESETVLAIERETLKQVQADIALKEIAMKTNKEKLRALRLLNNEREWRLQNTIVTSTILNAVGWVRKYGAVALISFLMLFCVVVMLLYAVCMYINSLLARFVNALACATFYWKNRTQCI